MIPVAVVELYVEAPLRVKRHWKSLTLAARAKKRSHSNIRRAALAQGLCAGSRWMTEETYKELTDGTYGNQKNLLQLSSVPASRRGASS
jgi:hypothetical protein